MQGVHQEINQRGRQRKLLGMLSLSGWVRVAGKETAAAVLEQWQERK